MQLKIQHQERYSRGRLILRTIFGYFYIYIPHLFLLSIFGFFSSILSFLTFWAILFTGRFPHYFFSYQIRYLNWQLRLFATEFNMVDVYPAFGLNGKSDVVSLELEYTEQVSRGSLLLRFFLGFFYVLIPHAFLLLFRMIASFVVTLFAWWSVLFTGKYPEVFHRFNLRTFRWIYRINLYLGYFTSEYPKFFGN